ncbi:SHOCT domain-containing protein [Derxia gummosa]|uniref:SHOCT domain-containing protein n=1 Tax=Derxia gummosa DSM 723 TaxID=1121388 RepID=A0A8B6X201_9BURK|nr:SHOCT domain-containing protein [Derxia gummosa]
MQQLTPSGEQAVADLARRYGVSSDAVRTLLDAVSAGGGTMAQFWHPELGGNGQWMRGGMTMVGDMFNSGLQSTVAGICSELSSLLANQPMYAPAQQQQQSQGGFMASGGNWWPAELGSPSSSGGQNDSRYAVFPQSRRLAISQGGQVTVYDTLDHNIGGVQQQQGGWPGSVTFNSQYGSFGVDSLPVVSGGAAGSPAPTPEAQTWNAPAAPAWNPAPAPPADAWSQSSPPAPAWNATPATGNAQASGGSSATGDDILATIERMAELHRKGILSDAEFSAKKAELLARL